LSALGTMRGFRPLSLSQINRISQRFARFSVRREYIGAKIAEEHTTMSNDVKENLKSQSTWKRGLYMLLYLIFSRVAEIVLGFVVLFQFLLKLFTGETNERLLKLGQGLSTYVYQTFQFLTFNSEYHPYPFGAWPKGEPKPAKISDQTESADS
ncbi:MAG: DUF4389 domain-containing protein, partial [Gammaproteobacteria bacterium]|nr:DUF4389 domain-containing protein [Gammaproteobacteria bacterium]